MTPSPRSIRRLSSLAILLALISLSGNRASAVGYDVFTEVEPNNDAATATPVPVGPPSLARFTGAISPATDVDFYRIAVNQTSRVWICTDAGSATPSTDTDIQLRASDGSTVLERDDDDGTGSAATASAPTEARR